jgi:hypothetical protein
LETHIQEEVNEDIGNLETDYQKETDICAE